MAITDLFGLSNKSSHAVELPPPEVDLAADANAAPGQTRSVVLGGGCFWCVEGVFDQLDGVTSVVSGYAGGTKETADYQSVCTGRTAHAEVIKIDYDPSKITFGTLLRVLFTVIDPTTKNRQGPDVGPQYRTAIFYENEEQKRVAEAYIRQLDAAEVLHAPIAATVEPLPPGGFYPAEGYHQKYAACHTNNGYIVQQALPKIAKVRAKFADRMKK